MTDDLPDGSRLRAAMGDPVAEEAVLASWQGVAEGRRRWRERRARRRTTASFLVGATLAIALAASLAAVREATSTPPGPLVGADGQPVPSELSAPGGPRTLRLSDGSAVHVDSGAEGTIVVNDGRRFVVLLRAGRMSFDVVPGGPRSWAVDAGRTRVEVVGTVFAVDRRPDEVGVDVTRGEVLVISAELAGGSVALGAGDSVVVADQSRRSLAHVEPPREAVPTPPVARRAPAPTEAVSAAPPEETAFPAALRPTDPIAALPETLTDELTGSVAEEAFATTDAPPQAAPIEGPVVAAVDETLPPPRWSLRGGGLVRHAGGLGPWLGGGETAVAFDALEVGLFGVGGRADDAPDRVAFGVAGALVRVRLSALRTGPFGLDAWLRGELGAAFFQGRRGARADDGAATQTDAFFGASVHASAAAELVGSLRLGRWATLELGLAVGVANPMTAQVREIDGTTRDLGTTGGLFGQGAVGLRWALD